MPHYFIDTSALVKRLPQRAGISQGGSDSRRARVEFFHCSTHARRGVFRLCEEARTAEIPDADFDRLRLRFYADIRDRRLTPVGILNVHYQ